MRLARVTVLALLGLAVVVGCSGPEPDPNDPGAVALHLFTRAANAPDPAELLEIFDPDGLADRKVPLLDTLDVIAGSSSPELLGVDIGPDSDEAFVDLAVELPGEGRAVYSVKLRRLEEFGWRIAWFQGPGVEWPTAGRRGAGLTTSAPPGSMGDGW